MILGVASRLNNFSQQMQRFENTLNTIGYMPIASTFVAAPLRVGVILIEAGVGIGYGVAGSAVAAGHYLAGNLTEASDWLQIAKAGAQFIGHGVLNIPRTLCEACSIGLITTLPFDVIAGANVLLDFPLVTFVKAAAAVAS